MSLYSRLGATDPESGIVKLAVWPMLNDMSLLLDGDRTFADLAERHGLDVTEQAELMKILSAVQTQLAGGATRQDVFHSAWHTLVAIERGVISEQRALQRLGVTD